MVGQHRVVKVEIHPLEGGTGGRADERIVAEALVVLHLARIQEPGRRDVPAWSPLGWSPTIDAKHDLVQVGQPCAGTVVAEVAHQRVVIPGLLSSARTDPGDLRVQVGDFDGSGYRAEMVRG